MKKNQSLKIMAWILIIIGAYDILNLLFKLGAGQSAYISNADVSGIIFLILGLLLLWRAKKGNNPNT